MDVSCLRPMPMHRNYISITLFFSGRPTTGGVKTIQDIYDRLDDLEKAEVREAVMKKYIYDEIAIKAVMNILNSLKVEGINQAQNLVKMAAILSAGEIEERGG